MTTISSFEIKNKELLGEIDSLREKQSMLIQNSFYPYSPSSPSHENLVKPIKCEQSNILKNKIEYRPNSLDKFTKGIDNLTLILGNQRESYNKAGLGYEPKNNAKGFIKICHTNRTSKRNILKYNYYNKNDHVAIFYFVRKSHESKKCLSYFSFL